jgi:hypothetical protein
MKFIKKMKIKNIPWDLVTIPTIGDGNCFLHAILGCCNNYYKNTNNENKKIIVRQLRNDTANLLDISINNSTFYEKLSRGQAEEISQYVTEMRKDYMQGYLKSNNWMNASFIELFSIVFNINIVIISAMEKDIYRTGDKELLFKERKTIFINYIDQAHFESIGIETPDGLKTIFHHDNEIVKLLNKII